MSRRRITISCPGCRDEFKEITVDEAEAILFNGCLKCRGAGKGSTATVEINVEEAEKAAREVEEPAAEETEAE